VLEEAATPHGTLTLRSCRIAGRDAFEIRLNGRYLISSEGAESERALGREALARWTRDGGPQSALVGGLGAGHTLAELLSCDSLERIVVVELSEKVVDWNRRYFAAVDGGPLADERVSVVVDDLFRYLAVSDERFDLLLLDVDNGPAALASRANARLYGREALRRIRERSHRGAVVGVWSAAPDPSLARLMAQEFGAVDALRVADPMLYGSDVPDVVYLASLTHGSEA
jgi:spermidine synthase